MSLEARLALNRTVAYQKRRRQAELGLQVTKQRMLEHPNSQRHTFFLTYYKYGIYSEYDERCPESVFASLLVMCQVVERDSTRLTSTVQVKILEQKLGIRWIWRVGVGWQTAPRCAP